ncbi:MAG: hypothetical protein AB7E05_14695 [Sphingobium sp.]
MTMVGMGFETGLMIAMASAHSRATGGRWAVAGRTVAAVPVNYALTCIITALLARHLPMSPSEASVTATLLSYLIFAVLAMMIFAAGSARRMWLWLGGATGVLGLLLALSIHLGGRI